MFGSIVSMIAVKEGMLSSSLAEGEVIPLSRQIRGARVADAYYPEREWLVVSAGAVLLRRVVCPSHLHTFVKETGERKSYEAAVLGLLAPDFLRIRRIPGMAVHSEES